MTGVLTPGDRRFRLTVKGNRWRFDEEYVNANNERYFTNKIFDGAQHISINPTAIALSRLPDPERTKWDDADSYYRYVNPQLVSERTPVDGCCEYLISLLGSENRFHRVIYGRDARLLTVTRSGTKYVVEDAGRRIPGDDGGQLRFRIVFDAAVGYNMTESYFEQGTGSSKEFYNEVVKTESTYKELASGVWVLDSGRQVTRTSGARVKRPGETERALKVTSVEIGDFELDPDEFALKNVPAGTVVYDSRRDPPMLHKVGKSPVDGARLEADLKGVPIAAQSDTRWKLGLIVGNLVIAAVLGSWLLFRWRRTKGAAPGDDSDHADLLRDC